MFTSVELRQKYLDFFASKGHAVVPSASLIPENDPTILFTTAGMHPLVPYLLGEKHPAGDKLTSCQKCIRTQDIDEVGDNRHETFFEMLGNWSLGAYFKKEAIEWAWEFLTDKKWLGLNPKKLAVSVFVGDADARFDEEVYSIWIGLDMPEERIAKLPKTNNWWIAGATGPCGPDTEMFYWVGESEFPLSGSNPGNDEVNWLEIWNNVFMQYNKKPDGSYEPLKQKNVDTGMGLERTLVALNGYADVFQTDTFWPLIQKIEEISGHEYAGSAEIRRSMRIIADHLRATTMIVGDDRGVGPSNVEQGYVVRRLIRRAIRHGRTLGIKNNFCSRIAEETIKVFVRIYPELEKNKNFVLEEINKEESKFRSTLENGIKEIDRIINKKLKMMDTATAVRWPPSDPIARSRFTINVVTPREAFDLYQSYGFPLELINEELARHALLIDAEEFKREFGKEYKKHQEVSRMGSEQKFKGGLAGTGEIETKYHTATHLLLSALNNVLGQGVLQKGSNITAERLRFDFNYAEKLTTEQLKQVEDLVNKKIKEDIKVEMLEMPRDEALKTVKVSFDPNKYPDIVKVYKIGDFSVELCGGPHVEHTGVLGQFKITKEEASSAGVRRIKAVLR
ncbi:MAG: alanine--tRNA ligase [Candidatus Magasanikbacteria bacterium RIFCSPLOWO2_01_FULL_43_20b]|uniref:Alanine--tRNA ligase n=1 Tax=Candidatus Magasanikbacteria bacterium RIFCSPLOWO2_12_FULL_43_12 TaxID=1798692 RepID=A0A1F6MS70_9BACT|nr:MAG: alanine--tRNA ligase [Candidatus Magasanikbacteria bacterium RIFCSPHIGHO2_02_FULL_44_13]OGH72547.1 MAG: alanine--tRNA ligase [Candidatus Magasanikbacteria bacterium RIFCSPLOWO2_02_FULL_43_22]OGH73626.1 MAG: alanine--tRNA ligase [Candidatus Magasanikbacteria bacterium RIFCSPLOWO2_01_FULL_43_20b]OGH74491.1 MAG: alanine--tRNA ligase [Candidatus Magasanikbacteria bacterium RIFCSPLOWO2_12_FULL_43_12]